MKRFFIGFSWFVIIHFCLSGLSGTIIGGIAYSKNPDNAAQAIAQAGDFGIQYGWIILLISLTIAIIGTKTGKLPYTEKKDKNKTPND